MLKTFKIELKRLQGEYIKIKAEHETIKQIEEQCKIKVLQENEFYTSDYEVGEEKERILSSKSDFRMNDEDFIEYCKLTHTEYLKNGLDVPNYETTADYKTAPTLRKLEDELIKIGIDIVVEKEKSNRAELQKIANHWKYKYELLDLILKLELK